MIVDHLGLLQRVHSGPFSESRKFIPLNQDLSLWNVSQITNSGI